MLLEKLNKEGLTLVMNVLGKTREPGVSAYRGDLVLVPGARREAGKGERKPPEAVLKQAALLADNEQFLFVSGLFEALAQAPVFLEKYKPYLTPETLTLFFVENIEQPIKTRLDGIVFRFVPYKDGMVWNETLDLLYLEKTDLKGQSAEDKVLTVYQAANQFDLKTETIPFDEALTRTIVVRKEAAVGPV